MPLTEDNIRQALTTVNFPGLSRDIVSFGFLESISIEGGKITLRLNIPMGSPAHQERIAEVRAGLPVLAGRRYRVEPKLG